MRVPMTLVTALAVVLGALTVPMRADSVGAAPAPERSSPRAATPSAAPTVGLVGDSISWQSEAEIRRHVGVTHRLVYFDAVIGGTIAVQRPSVVNAVRSPGGPDILLVELGTNDAGRNHTLTRFAADVRSTLDAVTPYVDAVVWFDMKSSGSAIYPDFNRNAPSFNATLRQIVAGYPKAVVGHYSAWADAIGAGAFAADLVHLSPWGEDELGRLARQAADGFDPALRTGPFWDVTDRFWAASAISWCAAEGIVSGYDNGSFRAVAGTVQFTVNRGQWLSMLWHQAGAPTGHPPAPWPDVPAWIDAAARWAAAEGVAAGFRDGTLRPSQSLSRAEAIAMLYRLSGSPPPDGLPPHGLSGVPPWVEGAVRLAVAQGVVAGYPDGSFGPDLAVIRAQAANFVYRFATAPAVPGTAVPPTTLPPPTTAPPTTAPPVTAPPTTPPIPTPSTTAPPTTAPTSSSTVPV